MREFPRHIQDHTALQELRDKVERQRLQLQELREQSRRLVEQVRQLREDARHQAPPWDGSCWRA